MYFFSGQPVTSTSFECSFTTSDPRSWHPPSHIAIRAYGNCSWTFLVMQPLSVLIHSLLQFSWLSSWKSGEERTCKGVMFLIRVELSTVWPFCLSLLEATGHMRPGKTHNRPTIWERCADEGEVMMVVKWTLVLRVFYSGIVLYTYYTLLSIKHFLASESHRMTRM